MANTGLYIPVLEERGRFKDYRPGVWGDSYNWYRLRSWSTIKHLVIHHSVTNPTDNHKSDVDYIAELHKRRGWGGIGYHFVITTDGTVWYVGDISMQRANVADKNHLVIGICLVGDFRDYNPTDEQILSAHDLCKFFIEDMPALTNVKDWSSLSGHKDHQATECPGPTWKGPADSMYERIKNRIPYTPAPEPEPSIDWEKRYKEHKEQADEQLEILRGQISTLTTVLTQTGVDLAEQKEECQEIVTDLKEKLVDAKSENPKIPGLSDYPDKEIFERAIGVLLSKVLNFFGPIYDKFKKSNGQPR